ncbi:Aminodeoxyfutalosine synthase [Allorhodopirellula solitaria]|uniref:Multifunctional fusion protein n=1 Tax=Allorhodopirellula solitaria TaxID=2527987 RepID=A0A5C5XPP5_9BACT|nr:Aminodeoxyfutalosine synthase [Allorhodopirellula solitaria]
MLRFGAVSYLNTKPLIETLPQRLADWGTLRLDLPSRLATDLSRGDLDVALIPSVEYFRHSEEYEIVSDAAIACRGPVWSVRLLSRVPMSEIQTLALDEGSRTSAAMAQVLLWEMHGVRPTTVPFPIGTDAADVSADAVLTIGDRAMHPPHGVYHEIWDLGDRWCRWTELPFVFAMWVARREISQDPAVRERIADTLNVCRDEGKQCFEAIAVREAAEHGLTNEDLHRYFAENLHFQLGSGERAGLELFRQKSEATGLITHSNPTTTTVSRSSSVRDILDKAVAGTRLDDADALALLQSHDLAAIGAAAEAVSRQKHPESYRTYNIDRNINYTNVCTAVCDFCAFYRGPKSDEGYVLPREVLLQKIQETVDLGGNQILLQGGLHPQFKLDWYEEMLGDIKSRFPQVNVHGFSPPELHHFTKMNRLSITEVLTRLKAAGLGSIPGGGAEILNDRVRGEITRGKVMTDDWLGVMRAWHELGGVSSATMMFGHVETLAERVEHLRRLRELQDETGGFTAFICWTFQPEHTEMSELPKIGSFEYLKMLAVSRLYLDNIPNLQSSWVTQGLKIGQMALMFGANDMGSLMIEENVVAEAGTVHYLSLQQIRGSIEEHGFEPRQRDVFYNLVDQELEQKAITANADASARELVQVSL